MGRGSGQPIAPEFETKNPIDIQKEGITEKKETVVRLHEPFKIKAVKRSGGHAIEWTMNLAWSDVDGMMDKEGPILQGISNATKIIEGPMRSRVVEIVEVKE